MRWFIALLLLATVACASIPAVAADRSATLMPDLSFDRVDTNDLVWRLSDFVVTRDGPAPTSPRPVYLHFGFMSCEPCHVLAARASAELRGRVELAYAHLDDVELDATEETLPVLWTRLYHFIESEPAYAGFVGLRRGNTELMRLLTGSEDAPTAILIEADGTFTVLATPSADEITAAFEAFLEAIR